MILQKEGSMPISTETKLRAVLTLLSTWLSVLAIVFFALYNDPISREWIVAGVVVSLIAPFHWIILFNSALRDILLAINEVQDTGADESTTTHQPA